MNIFIKILAAIILLFTWKRVQGQELHLNSGFGFDLRRNFPESNSILNEDISRLTPKFKYTLNASYRYAILENIGLSAVGGLGINQTSFYFPIRAENDYASTLYQNANFNFKQSSVSIGLHKRIDLYSGNVSINVGLNYNLIVNIQNQLYQDSRGNRIGDMESSIIFDTLYPSMRPYEFRMLVQQPKNLLSNIDFQIDVFFRLNDRAKFTFGMRIPFLGQFDEYYTKADLLLRSISFFQPSDPDLPPVAGYWYYHKSVSTSNYFWFASFNFGLLINLKN